MENEPDLKFDIDAYFKHMIENLDDDLSQEKEWHFVLRAGESSEPSQLEGAAEDLDGEFIVLWQEQVKVVDLDGDETFSGPMLSVVERGVLSAEDVKAIASRVQDVANERGLIYEGVDCYDPVDADELYGWIAPEDAGWRLRHMSDCGLEYDADLPWAFLIEAPSLDAVKRISAALESNGFEERDEYDEPNEDGNFGIGVFVQGRNNEVELNACADQISSTAEKLGGVLVGIQFYTREDVAEVFGLDDEL